MHDLGGIVHGYALRCQGIDNTTVNIVGFKPSSPIRKTFLVNTWNPAGGATPPYKDYPKISGDYIAWRQAGVKADGMSNGKYLVAAGEPAFEFTYAGATSQNNPIPAADFNCHFVVEIKDGAATTYYDPSYGNVYANPDVAALKAVAGFAQLRFTPAPASTPYFEITPVTTTKEGALAPGVPTLKNYITFKF